MRRGDATCADRPREGGRSVIGDAMRVTRADNALFRAFRCSLIQRLLVETNSLLTEKNREKRRLSSARVLRAKLLVITGDCAKRSGLLRTDNQVLTQERNGLKIANNRERTGGEACDNERKRATTPKPALRASSTIAKYSWRNPERHAFGNVSPRRPLSPRAPDNSRRSNRRRCGRGGRRAGRSLSPRR